MADWKTSSERSIRSANAHSPSSQEPSRVVPPAPARSTPIAIRRSRTTQEDGKKRRTSFRKRRDDVDRHRHDDDDDDDDDEDDDIDYTGTSPLEFSLDRLTVDSLPTKKRGIIGATRKSHLGNSVPLRAPKLTSRRAEGDLPQIALPEADAPLEGTYGSLRESHLTGRFWDGPMSYRDPRSGEIRMLADRRKGAQLRAAATKNQQQKAPPPPEAVAAAASSLPISALSLDGRCLPLSESIGEWSRPRPDVTTTKIISQQRTSSLSSSSSPPPPCHSNDGRVSSVGERISQSNSSRSLLNNGTTPPVSTLSDMLAGETGEDDNNPRQRATEEAKNNNGSQLKGMQPLPLVSSETGAAGGSEGRPPFFLSTSLTALEILGGGGGGASNVISTHHLCADSRRGSPAAVTAAALVPLYKETGGSSHESDDEHEQFDLDLE